MIAVLEETYEGYRLPVRSREEGQAVLRMAGRCWQGTEKTAPAARAERTEHLLRTIRELSRPMGGKLWTNRDELYER